MPVTNDPTTQGSIFCELLAELKLLLKWASTCTSGFIVVQLYNFIITNIKTTGTCICAF